MPKKFLDHYPLYTLGWLRGTVVERRFVAGELSLSHARLAADGRPLLWVKHLLQVRQPVFHPFRVDK